MVKEFFLRVNIIECDIVRQADGLALSSRNAYLDKSELDDALLISSSLKKAAKIIAQGERDANTVKLTIKNLLKKLKVEYVEITDREFNKIETIIPHNSRILIAAYAGLTRLIDNMEI